MISFYIGKKLSHSEIDCFATHLVNALYPSLISWLFICVFEHIIRLISGLKHKTYFVSITIIVLRIKWNQIQVCFIPVFKWTGVLRVMVEKKENWQVPRYAPVPGAVCLKGPNTRPVVWKALQSIHTINLQIRHFKTHFRDKEISLYLSPQINT